MATKADEVSSVPEPIRTTDSSNHDLGEAHMALPSRHFGRVPPPAAVVITCGHLRRRASHTYLDISPGPVLAMLLCVEQINTQQKKKRKEDFLERGKAAGKKLRTC